MILTMTEYEKAQKEIRDLRERLEKLQQSHPGGLKESTKAGVRKMIARLHE
jgi:cell division septum initiation protein DivIVA